MVFMQKINKNTIKYTKYISNTLPQTYAHKGYPLYTVFFLWIIIIYSYIKSMYLSIKTLLGVFSGYSGYPRPVRVSVVYISCILSVYLISSDFNQIINLFKK